MSRLRDFAKRAGRKGKVLAGRATITAGHVTGYVAPFVAGYVLGPYGIAAGAGLGVAGASLEASGRNLAGKKRQNVRVKIEQGAARGAVLGAAGYGTRTAIDYLTDSQSVVGNVKPETTTISGKNGGTVVDAKAGAAGKTLSTTKAGSVVEFDTASGTATVKASSEGLLGDLKPYGGTIAGLAGLLLQPGGSGQIPAPGGWGDYTLGYGTTDPNSVTGEAPAAGEFSPVLLIVLAVAFFFFFVKGKA